MVQLRVGIVGCGEVVQIIHLPTFAQLAEQFRAVALCDVSATVLHGVGDAWGIAARFADYRDLVRSPDVDAVLVTNPHAYHAEVVLAACAAGKHVFVEKPMCLTLAEADAITEAAVRAGVTVQVGYMRRYAPAFTEACRIVREELGAIRLARVHAVIGRNALVIAPTARVLRGDDLPAAINAAGQELQTRRVREALGDAADRYAGAYLLMLGLSSHDLSAMRELLGMPQGVLYAAERQGGRYLSAAFDYGTYVCQFETGVDDIARFDAHLEVYGAKATLRVQYDTPYVRNLPVRLTLTEASGESGVSTRTVHPAWGDSFAMEWRAFHENVTEGKTPKTTPADFRHDLALFAAMIQAMRNPATVRLA